MIVIFLLFTEKQNLLYHANHLRGRFPRNIKSYLHCIIKKKKLTYVMYRTQLFKASLA